MDAPETLTVRANGRRFEGYAYGTGEPLLCLHGFPDEPRTFDALAAELDGYRLLAPYMRGYGPSDGTPADDYGPAALGADAAALGNALDTDCIIGHDWGAVATYAALRSGAFDRAAVMAVPPRFDALLFAHPRQLLRSWYIWTFQLPGAVRLLRRDGFALVDRLYRSWSPGWDDPAHRERVKETLSAGETAANAVEYYRAMGRGLLAAVSDRGIRAPDEGQPFETPTLLLSGARDGCIGPALFEHAGDAFRRCRVVRIREAGHFLHREQPAIVANEIAAWLER
ncbi:alpha/beta fold hydrolase [Halosegnis sp.]|uniref:alpha/beta fold hydrolase n=1 Tax=Halosegnis sp. TaxID=2864959 RepID=UPI0035D4150B